MLLGRLTGRDQAASASGGRDPEPELDLGLFPPEVATDLRVQKRVIQGWAPGRAGSARNRTPIVRCLQLDGRGGQGLARAPIANEPPTPLRRAAQRGRVNQSPNESI
jgi:hypothetical protein